MAREGKKAICIYMDDYLYERLYYAAQRAGVTISGAIFQAADMWITLNDVPKRRASPVQHVPAADTEIPPAPQNASMNG